MAVATVKFVGTQALSAAFPTAGDLDIYARSTAAADDGGLTLYGADDAGDPIKGAIAHPSSGGKVETALTTPGSGWDDLYFAKYDDSGGALAGSMKIYAGNGTASTGTIHIHTQPSNTDTLIFGPVGFTQTATWVTAAASSAGQVQTVADLDVCAENLASFINDSATGTSVPVEGTGWTATAADPYITATVSGNTVTWTSRVTGASSLGWTFTPTDTSDIVVTSTTGVDGTLLGTIAAATTSISTSLGSGVNLDNEALTTTKTLPGGMVEDSQKVAVRGPFSFNVRMSADPTVSITSKIQISNDGTNWQDSATAVADLNTDWDQYLNPAEVAEYARWSITAHAGSAATICNAKFIY